MLPDAAEPVVPEPPLALEPVLPLELLPDVEPPVLPVEPLPLMLLELESIRPVIWT